MQETMWMFHRFRNDETLSETSSCHQTRINNARKVIYIYWGSSNHVRDTDSVTGCPVVFPVWSFFWNIMFNCSCLASLCSVSVSLWCCWGGAFSEHSFIYEDSEPHEIKLRLGLKGTSTDTFVPIRIRVCMFVCFACLMSSHVAAEKSKTLVSTAAEEWCGSE